MSLKINTSWQQVVKWVVLGLLAFLIVVFFVRVAVWESAYYSEKEGSERAVANSVASASEELDETEPTKEEIYEYVVAADRPRYLSVEKLGIENARIIPVYVNEDGELGTPNNIFDVGWYEASGKPGEGGTMLIDGHNGGPHVYGVFKELPALVAGDVVVVERGDGVILKYKVVENVEVLLTEADEYMVTAMKSPEEGKESLTLISCTGEWSQQQGTYLSRQFTRAVLISRSDQKSTQ